MEDKSKKKVRLVRAYSTEYKEAAVRRMEAGESPSALGKELGVARKVLYFWQSEVKAGQKMKEPGRPKSGIVAPPVTKGNQIAELERGIPGLVNNLRLC